MKTRNQTLGDFSESLVLANSFDQRFLLFCDVVQNLGFQGATYTFIPYIRSKLPQPNAPIFSASDGFPASFLEEYAARDLSQSDFTLRRVGEYHFSPMDWRQYEKEERITESEKEVVLSARHDHGVTNAITIPTMPGQTRSLGIAGASIVSANRDRQFLMLKKANLETLTACTYLFHSICHSQSDLSKIFVWPLFSELNSKDLEILRFIASGQIPKQFADQVKLTNGSVYRKLDMVRERYGIATLSELCYLFGLYNLLDRNL